jgi:transposase
MTRMPMPEELEALKKALSDALGELRVVRTERDLLKEQLNRFKRQLFDAKSEVSAAHQKDLFFNEAEIEGAQAQPAAAEPEGEKVEVPAHQRTKRGRKPLDPALPRDVRRHELPEDERVCPHDGSGTARDRRGSQRATGHRAAAGARDPPRAGEVRVPVLRRWPAPGGRSRRR